MNERKASAPPGAPKLGYDAPVACSIPLDICASHASSRVGVRSRLRLAMNASSPSPGPSDGSSS